MAAKLDPAELKKGKSQSYKDCPMSLLCLLASQSRIEDYDTDVDFVWRHSIDHQTNERIDFDSSLEFMKKLIISILDDPFKMVRYLGA